MNISDQCKKEILEHGILMNGNTPAGHKLMSLPTMKIAIVENEFPPELMTPEFSAFIKRKKGWDIGKPDNFPEGIEGVIRRGIGFWYNGNIKFVPINQNPDLKILAFDSKANIGGFASFPKNDIVDWLSEPVLGINMDAQRFMQKYTVTSKFTLLEKIQDTITHEFGHSIGILHTNETFSDIKQKSQNACFSDKNSTLGQQFAKSHMINLSSGISKSSDIDVLFREAIRNGCPNFECNPLRN